MSAQATQSSLIALSAGGDDKELARTGHQMFHVNQVLVRLSRRLLRENYRLGYGGNLNQLTNNLTLSLIDAAIGWSREIGEPGASAAPRVSILDRNTWPLVNWVAWPLDEYIDVKREADLACICDFRRVAPHEFDEAEKLAELNARAKAAGQTPEMLALGASALSRMRAESSRPAQTVARVVMAGKIDGWTGWLPGVAEEVAFSIQHEQPVIILGGFGGCAHEIARYLEAEKDELPASLSVEVALKNGKGAGGRNDGNAEIARQRHETMANSLRHLREAYRSPGESLFGFPKAAWKTLLHTQTPRTAIRGVLELCAAIKPPPA